MHFFIFYLDVIVGLKNEMIRICFQLYTRLKWPFVLHFMTFYIKCPVLAVAISTNIPQSVFFVIFPISSQAN